MSVPDKLNKNIKGCETIAIKLYIIKAGSNETAVNAINTIILQSITKGESNILNMYLDILYTLFIVYFTSSGLIPKVSIHHSLLLSLNLGLSLFNR